MSDAEPMFDPTDAVAPTEPTVDPIDPDNTVQVIGVVEPQRRQAKQRNRLGAPVQATRLHLLTPFDELFPLTLTLPGALPSQHKLQAQTPMVVTGHLRLAQSHDRRFVREDQIKGRPVRVMQVVVDAVRAATPDEAAAVGSSWVTLRGEVRDPPQFVPHPHVAGLKMALVTLQVTRTRPSPFPGSAQVRKETTMVHLGVATDDLDDDQAGLLYQPGNQVAVEGTLDAVVVPFARDDADVAATRAQIDAQWATTQAEVRDDPEAYRQAERQYLGQLRRVSDTVRMRVWVTQVTPRDDAQPISMRQAQALRREHLQERRQRRRGGRAAGSPAATNGADPGESPGPRRRQREPRRGEPAGDATDDSSVAAESPAAASAMPEVAASDATDATADVAEPDATRAAGDSTGNGVDDSVAESR